MVKTHQRPRTRDSQTKSKDKGPLGYDKTSVESIVNYAKKLAGKDLESVVSVPADEINPRNRGDLGSLVEKYFFEIKPRNDEQDFPDAGPTGLELKTTGVVKKSSGGYRAKERLVLMDINYMSIVNEEWGDSAFLKRCRLLLILCYLYSKDLPVHKRKFLKNPLLYDLLREDEEILRRDWELIRNKIKAGKAHELSEGDTLYLGACRKGSGGEKEKLKEQPGSEHQAKGRAFSFKSGFVNNVITPVTGEEDHPEPPENLSFEEDTIRKFDPYLGKTLSEIAKLLGLSDVNFKDKSVAAKLARRIVADGKEEARELEKAGIIVKTVRLRNGKLKESISFPHFKYLEIVDQDWDDSDFCDWVESRFLFVVIDILPDGKQVLEKVGYWHMPYPDRLEAEKVWNETKRRIAHGLSTLPRQSENEVAHVRPHARNKKDTLPTPQGTDQVKKSFWLNRGYVEKIVNAL